MNLLVASLNSPLKALRKYGETEQMRSNLTVKSVMRFGSPTRIVTVSGFRVLLGSVRGVGWVHL